ncbi:unnamed protein product [Cuscuta europaea]|uniref:Uncharacterized protein n=1 Tax=Cuscuta europaea TaxID=41803 RepID=A0A9P0ZQ96_CUSEU|nr:unnamed protein product [Cuscuta europaea]
MDVKSLFALKKQKAKAQKEPVKQKPTEAVEEPSAAVAGEAGGSQVMVASKKKMAGKGGDPPAKKHKVTDPDKQPASDEVIIVDEGVGSAPLPQEFVNEDFFVRERLEAVVPRGSSILEATLSPSVLMNQVMPSRDRVALARLDNEALSSKLLLNNALTLMGLCEQVRRVDQILKDKVAVVGR